VCVVGGGVRRAFEGFEVNVATEVRQEAAALPSSSRVIGDHRPEQSRNVVRRVRVRRTRQATATPPQKGALQEASASSASVSKVSESEAPSVVGVCG
jgi:hypothetical protein